MSVVSHGQRELLLELLSDLAAHVATPFKLILTENIPETAAFPVTSFPFEIVVVRNPTPKGFASNHNAALALGEGSFFCVLNPDIRVSADPFPVLVNALEDKTIGLVTPVVTDSNAIQEDHAREFPSVFTLLRKALVGHRPHLAAPAAQS